MRLHLTKFLQDGSLQLLLLVWGPGMVFAQDLTGVPSGSNTTISHESLTFGSSSSSSSSSSISSSISSSSGDSVSLGQTTTTSLSNIGFSHYTIYASYTPGHTLVTRTVTATVQDGGLEDANLFADEDHSADGHLSTFTSDGIEYIVEVFPGHTETISHTVMSSEHSYVSTGITTELITRESISYHFDFSNLLTSTSSYVHPTTTREDTERDHVETRTTHHAYSYPPVAWSLLHDKWSSEAWWRSVISVSEEHLRTMLGPVSTDPMLYLTTIYEWTSFIIEKDGYYVEYWEHVPILITLTAEAVTESVVWRDDVPYTFTDYDYMDHTKWEVITLAGSTVTEYVVNGVTHTEGPSGLAPKTEDRRTEDRRTEERREEDSSTVEATRGFASSEVSHTYGTLTSYETPSTERATVMSETTTVGPGRHTTTVYTETTLTTGADGRRSPKIIHHVKTPAVSPITSSVYIVGPYTFVTTVFTETTYSVATNGVTSPELIYQIFVPGLEPAWLPLFNGTPPEGPGASSVKSTTTGKAVTESITESDSHERTAVVASGTASVSPSSSSLPPSASAGSTSTHYESSEPTQMTTARSESTQASSESDELSDTFGTARTPQTSPTSEVPLETHLSSNDISPVSSASEERETTVARGAGAIHTPSDNETTNTLSPTTDGSMIPAAESHTVSVSIESTYSVGADGSTTPYTIHHSWSTLVPGSPTASPSGGDFNTPYSDHRPSITSIFTSNTTSTTGGGSGASGYVPYVFTHDTYTVSAYVGTALRQNPNVGFLTSIRGVTSWSTTVGPYSEITTFFAEVTYITGSDGLTTPDIIYHVRSPAASPIFSSTTTVGPYNVTTAVYTEETYTVRSDGRIVPKIIEHINTPAAKTAVPESMETVDVSSVTEFEESDSVGKMEVSTLEKSTVYEPGTYLFTTTVATEIKSVVGGDGKVSAVAIYHVQTPDLTTRGDGVLQAQSSLITDEDHLLTHYTGGVNDNSLLDIWEYIVYFLFSLLLL